jgi:hypothetical protein
LGIVLLGVPVYFLIQWLKKKNHAGVA